MSATRTLPAHGESSFNLVLKGVDLKHFNKKYPKKFKRNTPFTTNLTIGCVNRYYQYREFLPASDNAFFISLPIGLISPNVDIHYTVFVDKNPFCSFTDVREAILCSNSLHRYGSRVTSIIQSRV